MKTCPNCGSRYTDDTLAFCLSDGTALVSDDPRSQITIVLDEALTEVRPGVSELTHFSDLSPRSTPEPVPPAKSRTGLAVLLTVIGMLFLFGIVTVAGLFIWVNSGRYAAINTGNANTANANSNFPSPVPTVSTPRTSPNPTQQPTPNRRPSPTPEEPVRGATYKSTTRLTMGRGAFSTSFSGEINPGDQRSFVLACRAGQSLSATVTGGSCVSFSSGGASFTRTTAGGDNYVTITSKCSTVSSFSLRVSIF